MDDESNLVKLVRQFTHSQKNTETISNIKLQYRRQAETSSCKTAADSEIFNKNSHLEASPFHGVLSVDL